MATDLALFSVGFLVASTATFWIASETIGELALWGNGWNTLAIVIAVVIFAGLDLWQLHRGIFCSLGLRRQTPQHWGRRPIGVLAWGLDTGIPFTTVRATTLPFLGLVLAMVGIAPNWSGTVYGFGFLVILWCLCIVRIPKKPGAEGLYWLGEQLATFQPRARSVGIGLTLVGGTWIAWTSWVVGT